MRELSGLSHRRDVHRFFHALAEEVRREGFDDVIVDTCLDSFDDGGAVGLGADEDHWSGAIGLAEGSDKVQSVHLGHVAVAQDQLGLAGDDLGSGIHTIVGFDDVEFAQRLQRGTHDGPHGFGIIDHEYAHGVSRRLIG